MKIITVILLLLMPQWAAARVYMCVDHVTGATSFTDKACEAASAREEVRVEPANLDSGEHHAAPSKRKTWRSEAETRKTGADYSADRRSVFESQTAVSAR
jgi:hypothetical protein